jgi:hypothetical protein
MKTFTIILIMLLFPVLYGNSQGSPRSISRFTKSIFSSKTKQSNETVTSVDKIRLSPADSIKLDTLQKKVSKELSMISSLLKKPKAINGLSKKDSARLDSLQKKVSQDDSIISRLKSGTIAIYGFTKTESTRWDSIKNIQNNMLNQIPTFEISGLGTTQLTTNLSGSLNAQINICPTKNKAWSFLLNFNFGSSKDTMSLKDLSLSKIFFPDNSSFGFTGGVGLDVFALCGPRIHSIKHACIGEDEENYQYFSFTPMIEYLYRKINISDLKRSDSLSLVPRIETNTWLFEIEFGSHWEISNNLLNITISPYAKYQTITQGTDSTYQYIFKSNNGGKQLSRFIWSEGVNFTAQIGKVQLSFIYDHVSPKIIKEPELTGGTFIMKATLAADFLNLNFKRYPNDEQIEKHGSAYDKKVEKADRENDKKNKKPASNKAKVQ